MSDEKQLPQAWIEFCADILYELNCAGIAGKLDDMTDEEIDAALEKVRKPHYNRSSMQASRVISEKPSSNVGLVSAPQKYVG
jgi:hypothetical protein